MPYIVNISKAGYTVDDTDPRNLVFSSEFDALPIYMQGSANQTSVAFDPLTFTINHDLGYVPPALVYYKGSAFDYWKPDGSATGYGLYETDITTMEYRLDENDLTILVYPNNTDPETIYIKYFIFTKEL